MSIDRSFCSFSGADITFSIGDSYPRLKKTNLISQIETVGC